MRIVAHHSPSRHALAWWMACSLLLAAALGLTSIGHAAQQRTQFDHLTTGFELLGQHRDLPCEACHVNAIFKGTPRDCAACHGAGTTIRATRKSSIHIRSTDRCETCHTPVAWKPAVNFDHTQALGSCSSCHDGTHAQGKGPQHIDTNLECDACHSTIGWGGAVFNHDGVANGCVRCHNNVQATGMPPNHIPTGVPANQAVCEACHSSTNFMTWHDVTSTAAVHANVIGLVPCETCHETAPYLGMVPSTSTSVGDSRPLPALDKNHPTQAQAPACGDCHDTSSFTAVAAIRPANHIPTNAPCIQCHTTPGQNAVYSITGVHQGVTQCLTCHGPSVANTFANIRITTTPSDHIPIGALDCNGSGCHTTKNLNIGGFNIGSASPTNPTLNVAGHTTVAAAVPSCQSCHQTASYLGMLPSTSTMAGDSRPSTALDSLHPTAGDCGGCHTTTPTFGTDMTSAGKPANHIPTNAPCAQCHTTANNYATYSVTGTHQGVTGCVSCHGPSLANTFLNVTITTTPTNHIPIGSLDCNGSGCHTATNVSPGGFNLGSANINTPTLNVAGHTTVAAAIATCSTCHEAAPYVGMIASTNTVAGDSRPNSTLDTSHPTSGDCGGCHVTAPTFGNAVQTKPANHIPTSAPCAQCHTSTNFATYSVTGTHQGVTGCLLCHGPTVANTFANVTIVTTPGNHIPVGSLDCNGSGCHTTNNVNPGGFSLGSANISNPTLNVAGHSTVAGQVAACSTCHEAAPYLGMVASTNSLAGDSRPNTTLDAAHPTSGDCGACHSTTPTFASNQTGGSTKPSNHIPTNAPCAQCHTNAGNYALYSVTGTHQGVTGCLSCHAPGVASTFANVTIVTTPGNHIPIGSLDCNGSGCHTTNNVNPGGFSLGTANIRTPTLNTAGHTTVAAAVTSCQTCHQTASYLGLVASTATTAGDSRPSGTLDASHPTSGDCGGCHTTTPTFAGNVTSAAKPSNHIPTNAPCAQCHTTPGNYSAYVMGAQGHTGITSNCSQCHGAGLSFANMAPPTLVEPPTGPPAHIPVQTKADCLPCHSATNFTTFAGVTMTHAPVTGQACDSCHEYGMKWYGISNLWVRDGPNHHPGQDCGGSGCHSIPSRYKRVARPSATTTAGSPTATSTPNTSGTNSAAARTGVASAASGRVGSGTSAISATAAAASNIGTISPAAAGTAAGGVTARGGGAPGGSMLARLLGGGIAGAGATASGPTAFGVVGTGSAASAQAGGTAMSRHAAVGTNCVSCHSAAGGIGKPSTHIATTDACSSCHMTIAWLPVTRIDHTQVKGACASCHNGVIAKGKRSSHVATNANCDSCHTTNAWTPARFDHAAVAPRTCSTCHNAVHTIGKPRNHIPTTQQCDACHNVLAWMPVKLDHSVLTSACASCHNNAGAVGKPAGHMSTQRDCATCHTYPDWAVIIFKHTSAAYPGQHRATLSCVACHSSNTDQVPYLSPANVGTCAACHSKDFKPDAHPKTLKGGTLYTASELANCSGACHTYSDSTQSTITRSLPGPYHRVTDGTFKH